MAYKKNKKRRQSVLEDRTSYETYVGQRDYILSIKST
jgi:hypothetical protein